MLGTGRPPRKSWRHPHERCWSRAIARRACARAHSSATSTRRSNPARARSRVPPATPTPRTCCRSGRATAATLAGDSANKTRRANLTVQAHDETNSIIIPPILRCTARSSRWCASSTSGAQGADRRRDRRAQRRSHPRIGVQWQATDINVQSDGPRLRRERRHQLPARRRPRQHPRRRGRSAPRLGAGLNLGYRPRHHHAARYRHADPRHRRAGCRRSQATAAATSSRRRASSRSSSEAEYKSVRRCPSSPGSTQHSGERGANNQVNPFRPSSAKTWASSSSHPAHQRGRQRPLDLVQEVSSLAPSSVSAVDLITNNRQISTSVLVPTA